MGFFIPYENNKYVMEYHKKEVPLLKYSPCTPKDTTFSHVL